MKKSGFEKLKPQFFGPYNINKKIGDAAYELYLLEEGKIHNVFHVSFLYKVFRQRVKATSELPPLDEEGKIGPHSKRGHGHEGEEVEEYGHLRVCNFHVI